MNRFLGRALAVLALVLALIAPTVLEACTSQEAKGVTDVANVGVCIAAHDQEPPEQILKDCGQKVLLTLDDVIALLAAEKASRARHACTCAPAPGLPDGGAGAPRNVVTGPGL